MTTLTLSRAPSASVPKATKNPMPILLQTPSGLALLEMQGTINLPAHDDEDSTSTESLEGIVSQQTPIGRLVFPEYEEGEKGDGKWMKRVYLYVGKHQRLTGEVKKLPKAIAVIRKKHVEGDKERDVDMMDENSGEEGEGKEKVEDLEIVEIVKYKILFSLRPEPVGATVAAAAVAAGN